ncbi:MAG TPA: sensor histidine kinase [Chryseosolibacter sp.]|nr:sensor histidine kinase [Chryseosolibacter sp.]
MAFTKKQVINELRDIAILAATGILMTLSGIACRDCIDSVREFWIIASFASILWIALWKGNHYLGNFVTRSVSWLTNPVRKFFLYLAFTVIYTFGVMYSLGTIYKWVFGINLIHGALSSVYITIIISLFMHGRSFLINWKQTTIAAERLERENIAARYESLKNQVNPHFLFNSFNALSNLVYEDQDKAVKFIKKLSEVYRYVLDTREREVVTGSEEFDFLQSYMYLQEIRFGNKLRIEIRKDDRDFLVAPLAVQMLIENAIKHNVVSEDDPLTIEVFTDDDFLVVKNNLQPKSSSAEPSAGVGLDNITNRYAFLTSKKVEVIADPDSFIVKLPLLTQTDHEHRHH